MYLNTNHCGISSNQIMSIFSRFSFNFVFILMLIFSKYCVYQPSKKKKLINTQSPLSLHFPGFNFHILKHITGSHH